MKPKSLAAAIILIFLSALCLSHANPDKWKNEWPDTDFSKSSINLSEIISGGPPKDGIPAIDNPQHGAVYDVVDMYGDMEPMILVQLDNHSKAYPLSILMWHEIANDKIGSIPITITYCPLCNTSIVFDRRVQYKNKTSKLDFGVSGKLRHSDMIMYDRQTQSWWQQYTGEGIAGELTGKLLSQIPSKVVPFSEIKKHHPNTQVLMPTDHKFRDYGRNPYVGYDQLSNPFLYTGQYDGPGKALSYVIAIEDQAWLLSDVRASGSISRNQIKITWNQGMNSALSTKTIKKGRDIGFVHVARKLPDGSHSDIPYVMTFAFAFKAFHPDGTIHSQE